VLQGASGRHFVNIWSFFEAFLEVSAPKIAKFCRILIKKRPLSKFAQNPKKPKKVQNSRTPVKKRAHTVFA